MPELILLAAVGGVLSRPVCVQKQVVVKHVAVKQVVPVNTLFLVAPPNYYQPSSYAAPRYDSPAAATSDTDRQIVEALTTLTKAIGLLEQRMDRIEGGAALPPPEPSPELAEDAVPLVLRQSCGLCHGDGGEHQDSFSLSNLAQPAAREKAIQMVLSGKMPHGADGQPAAILPSTRENLLAALRGMR